MTRSAITLASLATLALLGSSALAQTAEPGIYTRASDKRVGDPYTLDTCPISGMKLGAMGESIVKVYNGREVRFCCAKCPEKFEADMDANFKKVDAMLIKNQQAYYPLTGCAVSGEKLKAGYADLIYGNRHVRVCCDNCISHFTDDSAEEIASYIAKLDAAIIAAQSDRYPLTTCLVSGEELGEKDETIEIIFANRLVRLCCKMCKKDLMSDPALFLKKLDAAWAASPGGMPGVGAVPVDPSEDGLFKKTAQSGAESTKQCEKHESDGATNQQDQ